MPKRGTGANLLVPVALSASAVAFSSTRIENMYMNVGSAAGVAAKQLVDGANSPGHSNHSYTASYISIVTLRTTYTKRRRPDFNVHAQAPLPPSRTSTWLWCRRS